MLTDPAGGPCFRGFVRAGPQFAMDWARRVEGVVNAGDTKTTGRASEGKRPASTTLREARAAARCKQKYAGKSGYKNDLRGFSKLHLFSSLRAGALSSGRTTSHSSSHRHSRQASAHAAPCDVPVVPDLPGVHPAGISFRSVARKPDDWVRSHGCFTELGANTSFSFSQK
jgi:hypothetical protein